MADGFKIIENHMSSHGISIEPLEDYFSCLIEYTEADRFDKNLFVRREAEKIVRGGSQHSTKTLERAFELSKKTYLYAARDDFHSYCVYLEWNREPNKRFYQPRMRVLRPIVQDMQDLIDDKLDLLAISLPPGSGKAQPLYSNVLTPNGFVKMGDISVGDKVISGNGKPCNVTGVYPQGIKSVYRVIFNDDTSTECCKEHLWYGQSRDDRTTNPWRSETRYRVFDLQTMMENVTVENGRRLNYSIDFVPPVEFKKRELLLHPYVLGVLLGDGSITGSNLSITFTSCDSEIVDHVRELLPVSDLVVQQNKTCYRIIKSDRSKGAHEKSKTRQAIDFYGLFGTNSKTKFIPQDYLLSSPDDRWELLRGLLDTDGYASNGKCAEFTTVSELLSNGVVSLVRSLGGRATVNTKIGTYRKDGEVITCSRVYRIYIIFDSGAQPFKLSRKADAYNPKREKIKKFIKSIEYVGETECQCITVDDPCRLYVTDDYIVTHNSTLQIFLHSWVMGRAPDKPNLASGHSGMLTGSIYDGVCSILNDQTEYLWADVFPETRNIITNAKETTIDLNKKHRFSTLTCRAIGASLTGATRCEGLLTADDLVSGIEEALSKERLDKLWEAYGNDLKSRKKLGAKELHLATRWSIHDVIGRLDRMYGSDERAKFVVIPALNANGESNFDYDYGVGFNTAFFEDMRNNIDDASFRALYMNEPIEREGQLYSPSEMRRFFELPQEEPDAIISICDTKDTGKDYQFLPVAYQYGNDYYIADCICNNGAPEVLDELSAEMLVKHKVKLCRFESNAAGGRAADKVQEKVKSRGGFTHITKKYTTANKETKILVNSPFVKEHMLFLDDSVVTRGSDYWRMLNFMFGYTQVGKNKNDDVPDGLAQLSEFIQSLNVSRIEVVKRPF